MQKLGVLVAVVACSACSSTQDIDPLLLEAEAAVRQVVDHPEYAEFEFAYQGIFHRTKMVCSSRVKIKIPFSDEVKLEPFIYKNGVVHMPSLDQVGYDRSRQSCALAYADAELAHTLAQLSD